MLKVMCGVFMLLTVGCASQKSLFGKESDTLSKSPCAATCRASAFYVNGKWM